MRRVCWGFLLCSCILWCVGCKQQTPPAPQQTPRRLAPHASVQPRVVPQRRASSPRPRPTPRLVLKQYQANLWQVGAAKEYRHLELLDVVATPTHAYACTAIQGFQVYDIRNPTSPKEVGEFRFPLPYGGYNKPGCRYVAVDGNRVYVSNTTNAYQPLPFVAAMELAKPRQPKVLAYYSNPQFNLAQLVAKGTHVYVTAHQQGLLHLHLTPRAKPVAKASTKPSTKPSRQGVQRRPVVKRGLQGTLRRTAQLAMGTAQGQTLDHQLGLVARLGGFQNAQGIVRYGDLLLVADGPGGLKIVSLPTRGQPMRIVGHHKTRGFARRVAVYRGHAYVSEGNSGFSIFDLRQPAKPQRVAQMPTPYSVVQIALDRDFAFVANWNDLRVYDIKHPTRPKLLAVRAFPKRKDTYRLPYEKSLTQIRNASLAVRYPHVILGEWLGLRVLRFAPRAVPILKTSTAAIALPVTSPGARGKKRVTVHNVGGAPLFVTKAGLVPRASTLSLSPTRLVVLPGQSGHLTVTFAPKRHGRIQRALRLTTNDPHQRDLSLALTASTQAGKGTHHRDFVLQDLQGRSHRLSKLRGKVVLLSYFATF